MEAALCGFVRGIEVIKHPPRKTTTLDRFINAGRAGEFRIQGVLGRGGMGVVLDAVNAAGHRVALKLLRPSSDPARDRMLRARFDREAELLGRVAHPGIAGLTDDGEIEGVRYLAMELIEGVTLATLRAQGALELHTILSLGAQLADALTHMHERGIVHRDIKPTNVLVTRGGRAVLTDFGVAWSRRSEPITVVGEIVGTPGYMAPELLDRVGEPSELSDLYALGFLLFEITSERPRLVPRLSLYDQFLMGRVIDWSRLPDDASWTPFKLVLERMLAEDPYARFTCAAEARSELLALRRAALRTPALPRSMEVNGPWEELSPFAEEPLVLEPMTEPGTGGDPQLAELTSSLEPETSWGSGGFDTPTRWMPQLNPTVAEPEEPAMRALVPTPLPHLRSLVGAITPLPPMPAPPPLHEEAAIASIDLVFTPPPRFVVPSGGAGASLSWMLIAVAFFLLGVVVTTWLR